VEAPDALVIWEAQYGDFANGAEIVIDQFIIAGLAKWGQTSRLTMLLPHGYEGQGPEHSSARLERFLALGAEGNLRVANCSIPAQYFHLLRDQALRDTPRPLVLMTPKGLLRLPAASSPIEDLSSNRFEPVLDDPKHSAVAEEVRRLVVCSGRIYYDLALAQRWTQSRDVAVARIEMLYPFPAARWASWCGAIRISRPSFGRRRSRATWRPQVRASRAARTRSARISDRRRLPPRALKPRRRQSRLASGGSGADRRRGHGRLRLNPAPPSHRG
jgi:hypothetical protein